MEISEYRNDLSKDEKYHTTLELVAEIRNYPGALSSVCESCIA